MDDFLLKEAENESTLQCSSGCKSGWTLYLDQSSELEMNAQQMGGCLMKIVGEKNAKVDHQDEEEDLSMVFDASFRPPHFHKDENGCFCSNSQVAKKRIKEKIKDPNIS